MSPTREELEKQRDDIDRQLAVTNANEENAAGGSWQIGDVLARVAQGAGIARDNLQHEADVAAQRFPDIAEREAYLMEWIRNNSAVASDPVALIHTLSGIVKDIIAGQAGVDRRAFGGNA